MLRKFFVLAGLLLASVSAPAAVIEYKGYSRDSSSNIVTGGGLEWLKWDVTQGKTVRQAINENSGWRLASVYEVIDMYNTFEFGRPFWDPSIKSMAHNEPWSVDENSPHNAFIKLFGSSIRGQCNPAPSWCYSPEDNSLSVHVLFEGKDRNSLGIAFVVEDSTLLDNGLGASDRFGHIAHIMTEGVTDFEFSRPGWGFVLVRTPQTDPTPVSLPSSLSLLALGLAGLAYRRRKGATVQRCGQAA
jgi:hypothetical protein